MGRPARGDRRQIARWTAAAGAAATLCGAPHDSAGQRARGDFLEIELSARQAALQGAALSDAFDALSLPRAPVAALDGIGWKIGAAHVRSLFDTSVQGLAMASPAGRIGWGGSLTVVRTGDVPVTDDSGSVVSRATVFDSVGSVTAAARLGEAGAFAANAKGFHSRIGSRSVSGIALDAEARYRLVQPVDLRVSAALRNAGVQGAFVHEQDPLPTSLTLAASHELAAGAGVSLLFCAAVERLLDLDEPNRVAVAVEARYLERAALRLGYRANETVNRLSMGAGVSARGFTLDWAFHPFSDLGSVHRVGVAYAFAGL